MAKPLATKTKLADDGAITLDIDVLEIVQEATATPYEHQKATTTVVILLVHLEVGRQVIDPIGKQGNLHLGRTRIVVALGELFDCFGLWREVGCGLTHNGITLEILGLD